ncbi:MAG: divalent-cation tolerance protein CutA [Dehalococcoidia bacterium]|nr:divalent-cation tolerance protein CutA [Dehalococcoidia bacterium]MDD5493680.1 divalent-cation tolerance protein CutA [Dehalococcoidia bacterium]
MKPSGFAVVIVTTSSRDEADKIASVLLKKRKAACVNIVPGVKSHFWWKGKIDSSDEVLMVIKTKASVLADVTETVRKNHSYTIPEIIALPIVSGDEDYLEWISREVRD